MRGQFEFRFHTVSAEDAALGTVDATLAMLGTQGWEIRGVATLRDGTVSVALQRRIDEEASALPEPPALSAALAEPLPPPLELLERELAEPETNVAGKKEHGNGR